MKIFVALAVIATAAFAASAPAANAARRTDNEDVRRVFVSSLLLTITADRDARRCAISGSDCISEFQQAEQMALIGWARFRRMPNAGLSSNVRLARTSAEKAFYRYWLASRNLEAVQLYDYVDNIHQAIMQAYATASRIGLAGWFNSAMLAGGCAQWRIAIRIAGEIPCH